MNKVISPKAYDQELYTFEDSSDSEAQECVFTQKKRSQMTSFIDNFQNTFQEM